MLSQLRPCRPSTRRSVVLLTSVRMFTVITMNIFSEWNRPKRLLVFVNPFGGKRRGPKIFNEKVRPLFELAGIYSEVISEFFSCFVQKIYRVACQTYFFGLIYTHSFILSLALFMLIFSLVLFLNTLYHVFLVLFIPSMFHEQFKVEVCLYCVKACLYCIEVHVHFCDLGKLLI